MSDLIERQVAIDAFERFIHELGIEDEPYNYGEMALSVQNVPSVENKGEQRPKGHWITQRNIAHQKDYYYCSECREEFSYDGETGIKMSDYNYCPNCGADMRGE